MVSKFQSAIINYTLITTVNVHNRLKTTSRLHLSLMQMLYSGKYSAGEVAHTHGHQTNSIDSSSSLLIDKYFKHYCVQLFPLIHSPDTN